MLDTTLTILTVIFLLVIAGGAYAMIKKGVRKAEVIQDVCSMMTYTIGDNAKLTVVYTVFVAVALALFNYVWPVPMYTTLIVATWALGWMVQLTVFVIAKEKFGDMNMFGFKVLHVFCK